MLKFRLMLAKTLPKKEPCKLWKPATIFKTILSNHGLMIFSYGVVFRVKRTAMMRDSRLTGSNHMVWSGFKNHGQVWVQIYTTHYQIHPRGQIRWIVGETYGWCVVGIKGQHEYGMCVPHYHHGLYIEMAMCPHGQRGGMAQHQCQTCIAVSWCHRRTCPS